METRKNVVQKLGDWLAERQIAPRNKHWGAVLRWLTPNGGTLVLLVAFLFAQSVGAIPLPAREAAPAWPAAPTINYQGRLADSAGTPVNDTVAMQFTLYDAITDGTALWGPETHSTVPVSEGLFSVGLGSQTAGGIPTDVLSGDVWLEITVDGETLSPREQLRAVPYAMQASVALTVPDGSIGTEQIADGAVTQAKAPFAPSTYWYSIDSEADPNMKTAVSTHVFDLDGATSKEIDVSAYGFTDRPAGICEIVDTSVTVKNYFCAYSWDGSNKDKVTLRFYNYSGADSGPSGNLRIVLWLMGK